nr:hypothetical protein [uncultured Cohaesibacter sp.]
MTIKFIQVIMSQGEISPYLHSRSDLEQFRKGLEICRNYILMRHGGIYKRSGTRFVDLARNQNAACRLVPFVFSMKQHYMLEFGTGFIRFYSEKAQLQASDGSGAYEIANSFDQGQLSEFDYTQSSDVLTLVHGSHEPSELKRNGDVDWSLAAITFDSQIDGWGEESWPQHVCYFNERITFANWKSDPQGIAYSKSGAFKVLKYTGEAGELAADDAMYLSILAGQVNEINWIAEGEEMLVGTATSARIVGPSDSSEVFGPTNSRQKRQATYGSRAVKPVQVGDALLYVGFYGRNLHEYIYDSSAYKFIAPDLTVVNEHFFRSGIAEQAFQQLPDSIDWIRMENRTFVALTYERDQQIVGAVGIELGGGGKVEAVATKPGKTGDELWLQVVRTLNGEEVRTIEILDPPFEDQAVEDGFFMDCGMTYEGDPINEVTNLPDLFEGQEVAILADGVVMPRQMVAGNKFTLPNNQTASKIHFGFPFRAHGKTLQIVDGRADGTAMGERKRVQQIGMDVIRTADLQVSQSEPDEALETGDFEELTPMEGDELVSNSVRLQTGLLSVSQDGWSDTGSFHFWSDKPLPCRIRAIKTTVDL